MFPLYDFLIYCFICAYTPGANNLLSMSNAARLGFRRSISFNFGITAGFFFVMSICTLCSTALYTFLPKVKLVMQVLGAGYMLYLAWKVWKNSGELSADGGKEASFAAGMLLQFMNPKIYIYAITAMSLYILPIYSSPLSRLLCMVPIRRCPLPVFRPAYKGRKPGNGPAPGVLRSLPVSVDPAFF